MRMGRRTIAVTLAALATVAVLVAVAAALRSGGTDADPMADRQGGAGVAPIPPHTSVVAALASLTVLRDWDRGRAAAWRTGDADALRRLYTAGSEAGARDVAMLRRWR